MPLAAYEFAGSRFKLPHLPETNTHHSFIHACCSGYKTNNKQSPAIMFTKWKRDKDQYPSQPTQASFPMPAPGTSGYPSSYQYGYNNNTAAPPPIPPRPYNLSPAVPPYPSAANPNMSAGGMSRQYINAVYYPNWRIYKQLPPSKLQVNNITHVFYAFIGFVDTKPPVQILRASDLLMLLTNKQRQQRRHAQAL